ncbi:MAG: hypothetical protein H3C36_02830 [Chitinophagaceae bacterium]|jgi:hypothetical protein|nr:hypothetical protein [Chitinophagaceae bacterium]
MAMNIDTLKGKIADLLTDMLERDNTSIDEFATRLATAVVEEVQSADIIYTSGLVAPSGGGPVTGTFEGNLV